MAVNRRYAIAALSAAAAGAAGVGLIVTVPSAAATTADMDLTSPGARLRTFMMVKGALDDRLVIRWINSRNYAVIDDAITPMYDTRSASFSRHRPITDGRYAGGYEMVSGEVAWYTDLASGKVIDLWYNPYLGRKVTIPYGGLAPMRSVITADLSIRSEGESGGMDFAYEIPPFDRHAANDLWITELMRRSAPAKGGKRPFHYSQNSVFRTTLADLSRPGAQHVTSDVSFTNLSTWRPYLEMADHPGHMMSMGVGQQGAVFDNISDQWKAATRERRPDVFKDPSSILAAVWDSKGDWR